MLLLPQSSTLGNLTAKASVISIGVKLARVRNREAKCCLFFVQFHKRNTAMNFSIVGILRNFKVKRFVPRLAAGGGRAEFEILAGAQLALA